MGLQNDVFNELKNKKFYLEKDLIEIFSGKISFQSYEDKIKRITHIINEISIIATSFNLVELYIKENNEHESSS